MTHSAVKTGHVFFFKPLWYTATQLARQVQQERAQVVRRNKVARKRLALRHSRNMIICMFCFIVVVVK